MRCFADFVCFNVRAIAGSGEEASHGMTWCGIAGEERLSSSARSLAALLELRARRQRGPIYLVHVVVGDLVLEQGEAARWKDCAISCGRPLSLAYS